MCTPVYRTASRKTQACIANDPQSVSVYGLLSSGHQACHSHFWFRQLQLEFCSEWPQLLASTSFFPPSAEYIVHTTLRVIFKNKYLVVWPFQTESALWLTCLKFYSLPIMPRIPWKLLTMAFLTSPNTFPTLFLNHAQLTPSRRPFLLLFPALQMAHPSLHSSFCSNVTSLERLYLITTSVIAHLIPTHCHSSALYSASSFSWHLSLSDIIWAQ